MKEKLTILIIGGYGTFGGRLVELLEDEPRLTLIIAGRSLDKAQSYCTKRGKTAARLIAVRFDRSGDLAAQLTDLKPDIVVDASGPFQAYGADRYKLIEACIAHGVHYLDLADGSDFVAGVHVFDDAACAASVFVLSGVSSFPVLTACVVRELSQEMAQVCSIHGGIAPSPFAGVGKNVIRAIAGYAGQPVKLRRNGKEDTVYPLTESMRYMIAPPGYVPLENRLFSLVDVPDLRLLQGNWPEAKNIWMGAAPVPEILHYMLICFSWMVRLEWLSSLSFLAKLMHIVTNIVRWGEHRGGMFVEVRGKTAGGVDIKKSWHLLAEGKDGPLIPSMAIEAIIRKMIEGHLPAIGARAALNDLTLADYDKLFAKRTIYTGVCEDASNALPLYKKILGTAWSKLPPPISVMHGRSSSAEAKGYASVERGHNWIANVIAFIMGFPAKAKKIPVTVEFFVDANRELWKRTFGIKSFKSFQYAGKGRWKKLLVERFGPLSFAMALVPEGNRLNLVIRYWSILGIPLPLSLAPRSDSYEFVEDGKFHFNVRIFYPFIGLIVHYRGWLERSK